MKAREDVLCMDPEVLSRNQNADIVSTDENGLGSEEWILPWDSLIKFQLVQISTVGLEVSPALCCLKEFLRARIWNSVPCSVAGNVDVGSFPAA